MLQQLFAYLQRYERHLSAFAMVAGFVIDSLFFERIDLWRTQVVFALYAAVCFASITLLHWIESRSIQVHARLRLILPVATQFALGGFWSGFLIFYYRSADLAASWPFVLFLVLVFLGNEYFHRYHSRLVFTSVLFFFALYSYFIFAIPIYTGTIGPWTFLLSGAVAVAIFALFTIVLRIVGRERFLSQVTRIRFGAIVVLVLMNVAYFTNVLPPLPLSAVAGGVYHSVWRVPGDYFALQEPQSWGVRYLGFAPVLHVMPGESVYAYSSVFAPTALMTTVAHRWQWYDPKAGEWVQRAAIRYPISGGREEGYRGYSAVLISAPGKWRVNVETSDGRIIARLPFRAVYASTTPARDTIVLE